jgi:POT family proton-dependent oligopeptide transporter
MAKFEYLTAPVKSDQMPSGVPYIVGNEAAERFSYYGMRSILVIFMTHYLLDRSGNKALMTAEQAKFWYHLFVSSVYFFPLFGAIIADAFWGKFRTIMILSLVYCLGNFALALDGTRLGLFLGMALIAVGSGGIKPCVSANVGDQFGPANQHLLSKMFGWFYFSINVGSTLSMFLVPELMDKHGPQWAFALPGVLMVLATVVFWLGRKKFVHVPAGGTAFVRETFSSTGLGALGQLVIIYLLVAVFFSLYDQSGSAWVLQAERMDRHFLGKEWLASQIQTINPVLVLLYIPLFNYGLYPLMDKVFPLTPLRKISAGLFVTVVSFLISAWIERQLDAGIKLNVGWQLLAFVVLTAGEIMVSITSLEFSYTQAPRKMKSLVMSVFLASIALGNAITAAVNYWIQKPAVSTWLFGSTKVVGEVYYLLFAALMLVTAILFIFVALLYREKTYLQDAA